MPSALAYGLMGAASGYLSGAKQENDLDIQNAQARALMAARFQEQQQLAALTHQYNSQEVVQKAITDFQTNSALATQKAGAESALADKNNAASAGRTQAKITSDQQIANSSNSTRLQAAGIEANGALARTGYTLNSDGTMSRITGGPADPSVSAVNLTPDALKNAAWSFIMNGNMPSLGRSKEALQVRAQIMNQVATIAKNAGVSPADLATQGGRVKAIQSSLKNLQTQSDVMNKSEQTFNNNASVLLNLSDQVGRTSVVPFNRWILNSKTATGDTPAAQFFAARNIVAQEYAKIASSATGAAGSSDAAQAHALSLIDNAQSPAQLKGVIQTLGMDINGQKTATDSQLHNAATRMEQFGASNQYPDASSPANHGASSGLPGALTTPTVPASAPNSFGASPSNAANPGTPTSLTTPNASALPSATGTGLSSNPIIQSTPNLPTAPVAPGSSTAPASPYAEGTTLNGPGGKYIVTNGVPVLQPSN